MISGTVWRATVPDRGDPLDLPAPDYGKGRGCPGRVSEMAVLAFADEQTLLAHTPDKTERAGSG